MSDKPAVKLPDTTAEILQLVQACQEKRSNCTMAFRTELWLRHGGEEMDISPANFHHALAGWLTGAGLVGKDKSKEVAAALYCLGVTNSNNLFQKVHQGKLAPHGIGKNGRRNAKSKK